MNQAYSGVERELSDIRGMPYGTARIAAAEQVARRLESDGPRKYLAEALLDLVEAYTFAGQGVKSFVIFARALRLWDESPELFDAGDERNLFWEFKWIASDLPEYPQITPAQSAAFLADMERRFELAGHGTSTVRMSRFRWAWHTGAADVEARRIAWITGLRDEFEDCRACTIGQQVEFFTESGRWAEAVELGLTQDSHCNLEPTRTHHSVALAALLNGDPRRAVASYRLARATLDSGSGDFSTEQAQAFELLARGGHLGRALRHLRVDCAELIDEGASPLLRLRFLLGVLAGLSANLDEGDTETGLRDADDDRSTVALLHAGVLREAEALAAQFDARNGTGYYADAIRTALAATRTEQVLDFGEPPEATAHAASAGSDQAEDTDPAGSAGQTGSADRTEAARDGLPCALPTEPGAATGLSQPGGTARAAATSIAVAEAHVSVRAFGAASRDYAAAALSYADDGRVDAAGLAYAEAAQCAALDGDDDASHQLFARAIPWMRSGGADPEAIVAVLTAWAPIAARMNESSPHVLAVSAVLDEYGAFDATGLADELAERRRAEWGKRRATLRDTLARSIAAADPSRLPEGADPASAIGLALAAGEEYAGLGMISDAAHAFWLAGRLQRDQGDASAAQWSLESAFEGFTAARQRDDRIRAAGDLIDLLRATDQTELAEQVTSQLTN